MKTLILPLALSVSLAACGDGDGTASTRTAKTENGATVSVQVKDAWCRPTPNGRDATACYMTVTADQPDVLLAASTPGAREIQIHEMVMDGEMMRMGQMTGGLPLPSRKAETLAAEGKHLMVLGLTGPLAVGDTLSLTLDFETAPDVTVQAAVRLP